MGKNYFLKTILLVSCWLLITNSTKAQVTYGASGVYGLRLMVPTYTGSAVQIRRTCDNATTDVGFSCGALNTGTIDRFVLASNPLSTISSASAASFSLRKLSCAYAGNAINVRRSCDNATKDIGFTASGDLDTTSLKTFVLASNPVSAVSTAAAAAYGLRKLNCAYAGKAIKVRSSAGGTSDIGFTATGDLDTAALKAFVLGNSGFVTTWYDQSGNGINATQATNANQPRIVNAGVIDRQNKLPAIRYISGSNMYLLIAQASVFTLADSYVIGSADVASAASNWWGAYRTGGNKGGANRSLANGEAGTVSGFSIWSDWNGYAVDSVYVNQVASNTTPASRSNLASATLSQVTTRQLAPVTAGTYASTGITFGGDAQSTYAALTGYLNEIVFFSSALSRTDEIYMQWNQAQYYDISGVSITTYPAGISNGYVATWYDQSGNSRNATQATTASQPRIMNAGVIDRQNNLPAIYFGGLTYGLSTASFNTYGAAACFNGVARVNTDVTYNAIANKTGTGAGINYPGPLDFYNNQVLVGNGIAGQYNTFAATSNFNAATTTSLGIWTYQANGTANNGVNAYYNSTQVVTNQKATYYGDNNTPLYLGSRADGVTGLNGWISEVLTFNVIPSTTDRAYLEYTQGQYYGVAGPTLGTLPASPANAYIAKWYDQSGNGNDLVQATTANQPRLVNAGVINLQGSLPAIQLDGSNYYMGQSTLSIPNPYTANAVATQTGAAGGASSGYERLVNISATGDSYGFMGSFTSAGVTNYATFTGNGAGTWNDIAADVPNTAVTLNAQSILSMVVATGAAGLVPSINGTALTGKAGTAATATGFLIGAPYSTSTLNQLWTGNISEFTIFTSALNTTRRTLLETNQGAYFGLAPSNSKYTVAGSYNLFVSGVGRTSNVDSVADSRASAGMGIIVGTTATDYIKDNGDYITIGTTCPTAAVTTALNMPVGATAGYERWLNDWYLNKTDVGANNGNVQLFFDFSDYGVAGVPVTASNYQLWGRANTAANFTLVTTTSTVISGDRVVFTLPAANLGTTGYYTIGTIDYQNSPLPIELLSFSAVPDGNKVDIAWETVTETNNAYFTIEKSKDGVSFTKLMDVPGAGTCTSYRNYAEVDYTPYEGKSYYRLKQTDKNGAATYFTMVPVTISANGQQPQITLYPNPIDNTSDLRVELTGYNKKEVLVVLRDIQGKEFLTKVLFSEEDNHVFLVNDTRKLPEGTYIITATSNDKIFNYKLIVR